MDSLSKLEREFHLAMTGIYKRALDETGYKASRFLQMVTEHGGLETAKILINAKKPSDGYTELWTRGRLDLTVEALALQAKWMELFSDRELELARKRLAEYGGNF